MAVSEITPKYDSTLGLIFRLNNLWAEADISAKSGDYAEWNNVLDRIYNNLAYRGKTNVIKDDNKKIISMEIDDFDNDEYKFLSMKVNNCKQAYLKARKTKGITKGIPNEKIARSRWYKALNTKDVWLRRFMNKLNLYIKETKIGRAHV